MVHKTAEDGLEELGLFILFVMRCSENINKHTYCEINWSKLRIKMI